MKGRRSCSKLAAGAAEGGESAAAAIRVAACGMDKESHPRKATAHNVSAAPPHIAEILIRLLEIEFRTPDGRIAGLCEAGRSVELAGSAAGMSSSGAIFALEIAGIRSIFRH